MLSSFFFNDPATTEIYTLSLHDALPISAMMKSFFFLLLPLPFATNSSAENQKIVRLDYGTRDREGKFRQRSEEHTSELQSHSDLVCRLLLEKKKKKQTKIYET